MERAPAVPREALGLPAGHASQPACPWHRKHPQGQPALLHRHRLCHAEPRATALLGSRQLHAQGRQGAPPGARAHPAAPCPAGRHWHAGPVQTHVWPGTTLALRRSSPLPHHQLPASSLPAAGPHQDAALPRWGASTWLRLGARLPTGPTELGRQQEGAALPGASRTAGRDPEPPRPPRAGGDAGARELEPGAEAGQGAQYSQQAAAGEQQAEAPHPRQRGVPGVGPQHLPRHHEHGAVHR